MKYFISYRYTGTITSARQCGYGNGAVEANGHPMNLARIRLIEAQLEKEHGLKNVTILHISKLDE